MGRRGGTSRLIGSGFGTNSSPPRQYMDRRWSSLCATLEKESSVAGLRLTPGAGWIPINVPYCSLSELHAIVAAPEAVSSPPRKQVPSSTTGAGQLGPHKGGENLRAAVIGAGAKARGRRPRLWFVEDRLETLQHVTTVGDLADVQLFPRRLGVQHAGDAGNHQGRDGRPCFSRPVDGFRCQTWDTWL